MAKDRDERTPPNPPSNVRMQIARPVSETDVDQTPPMGSVQVPPEVQAVVDAHAMPRRVKETRDASMASLKQVEDVREELKGEIGMVKEEVQNVAVSVAKISGQVPLILSAVDDLREQNRDRANLGVAAAQANIAINQANQVAVIENRVSKAKFYREAIGWVIAAAGALYAFLSAVGC